MSDNNSQLGDLVGIVRDAFGSNCEITQCDTLAGDASTRRYSRVHLSGAGAPATAIAMLLADKAIALSSEELGTGQRPDELPYVNVDRFLRKVGIAVPELYRDAFDQGILLLEDVGDLALWDAIEPLSTDRRLVLYRSAIDELLKFHVDATAARDDDCVAFSHSFDAAVFEWEFEHFIEWGIEKRLEITMPAEEKRILRSEFTVISEALGSQDMVINHRDYHSWNLHLHQGRIRVIDFQDALLAPVTYDLATLLGDRDTPHRVTKDMEEELLEYFESEFRRRAAAHKSVPNGPASMRHSYTLCALQKALKVVGRFYFLALEKKKPGYLGFIPATVQRVQVLLPQVAELERSAPIIRRYLPAT